MTPEERLDRIEHLLAGWVEQSKKEHDENRRLWRETQDQIAETSRILHHFGTVTHASFAEMRTEFAARDKAMDERIERLVSAMGQFIDRAASMKLTK